MGEAAQIVTAVCSLLTAVIVPLVAGYFLLKQQEVKNAYELAVASALRQEDAAKEAARKVDEVKTTLAETTSKTDGKLDTIHKLVNAAMTSQLKINAEQARRIARDNPADATAQAAADASEKLFKDHELGQARDTRPKADMAGVSGGDRITTVTAPVLVLPPDAKAP